VIPTSIKAFEHLSVCFFVKGENCGRYTSFKPGGNRMHVVPATDEYIPLGIHFLKKGAVVVLPTDTLYGVCADALNYRAVEKIFELKHRRPNKPLIVLTPSVEWIKNFFFVKEIPPSAEKLLNAPYPVSVILPVEGFDWISRATGTIAFRVVKRGFIKQFLEAYGRPIVAPSANWEGFPPARDPFQALLYFGNGVSVYYNGGVLKGEPSAVVEVKGKTLSVLRRGRIPEKVLQELLKT